MQWPSVSRRAGEWPLILCSGGAATKSNSGYMTYSITKHHASAPRAAVEHTATITGWTDKVRATRLMTGKARSMNTNRRTSMFGWLKKSRRAVTRFDYLAKSYRAMVTPACSMRCLRHYFSDRA